MESRGSNYVFGSVVLTVCLWCFNIYGATYDLTGWFDNFERDATCNSLIKDTIPLSDYGQQNGWYKKWVMWGEGVSTHTRVECTTICDGVRGMRTEFNADDMPDGGGAVGQPVSPYILPHPGAIDVYEHDVFIPEGSKAEMRVTGSVTPAGWFADVNNPNSPHRTWRYLKYPMISGGVRDDNEVGWARFYAKSDVPVAANTWNHVRLEVHHEDANWKFNMWVTPQGGSETLVVQNAPCPIMVWGDYNRGWYLSRKDNVYWDNVYVGWIDEEAQGYPLIGKAPSGIVIDGHINTSEWAGVHKVAQKPTGSNGATGDFEPFWYRDYNPLQDPDVAIDVYAAYDSNNFYIAGRFNKAQYGQPTGSCNTSSEIGCNSLFEAVFVYDTRPYDDANDYLNDCEYLFRCVAKYTQAIDNNDLFAIKYKGSGYYSGPPYYISSQSCSRDRVYKYSNVKAAGGQMSYSITGDVMDVEMKIPFAAMTEFAGRVPGQKLVLQFNASCPTDGWFANRQGLVTTNINSERIPWERSWISEFVPYGAGVKFPLDGDYDLSGTVNFVDFSVLAQKWLQSDSAISLTGSSLVDWQDMQVLALSWLQTIYGED